MFSVKFQNGQLGVVSKNATQFTRLLQKRGKESIANVAMVISNDQIYHGIVDVSEAAALTDTYICVRNKVTNKVLHEIYFIYLMIFCKILLYPIASYYSY